MHPPFFSKFEIQLTDISLWYLFWFGNVFGFPLIGPPIVSLLYFMVQQTWFFLKTSWYFWYVLLIERSDPNYEDYTLGNWGYYLFLSMFLQWLIAPCIVLTSIIPFINWLNVYWLQLYFYVIAYPEGDTS